MRKISDGIEKSLILSEVAIRDAALRRLFRVRGRTALVQ